MNRDNVHQGRNVRRFREMMGWKQEGLAFEMGGDWTQKRVSLLEQRQVIDPSILKEVSQALKIPVEAIESLDEEGAVNIISNNFDNCAQPASVFYNSTINPIEKWMEALEENRKLYERMLKEKDDIIKMLMEKK